MSVIMFVPSLPSFIFLLVLLLPRPVLLKSLLPVVLLLPLCVPLTYPCVTVKIMAVVSLLKVSLLRVNVRLVFLNRFYPVHVLTLFLRRHRVFCLLLVLLVGPAAAQSCRPVCSVSAPPVFPPVLLFPHPRRVVCRIVLLLL